ncbi:hypothetical protein CR513_53526, partial [Mucuna pruriens]
MVEPHTYKHTIKSVEWIEAMQCELQALTQNDTWNIIQLPTKKLFDTYAAIFKITPGYCCCQPLASTQLVVHNAFLHGHLNEEVYMELRQGILPTNQIKFANSRINSGFCYGYTQSSSEHSIFIKHHNNSSIVPLVYNKGSMLDHGIHIFQMKYALDILSDMGLLTSKFVSTPMTKNTNL